MLAPMNGSGVRRVLAALSLLLVLPAGLAACAGGPPTVAPTGVDELTIPTPTPDPSDFVDPDTDESAVNPWFPLEPGRVWTYRRHELQDTYVERVTVTDRTRVVAGVTTRVVGDELVDTSQRVVSSHERYYAQDSLGNVWFFGVAGDWEAGAAGAEAGLAMPAHPRLGDGFVVDAGPGTAEDRAEVLALDAKRDVPAGSFDDLLEVEQTTPHQTGLVRRAYYAAGVGLVFQETVAGGTELVELVARG
ncbi:hypothetical protein NLS1_42040 [Nocardioides sp. LS1]|nr:hypothetical protein NLS1_42040 [Nocardioides sp. LS1]